MLMTLGRGLSPAASSLAARAFDLTAALPSEITYTRNDTVATRRNASGKLVALAAHAARFDHDAAGNPLGLLVEGSRQNKSLLYSASPTTTTGLTVASGAPTLSIVTDATALAAAGLDQIGNGNVFKIDAGGADCDVDLDGTTGNTNPHSFSLYARLVGGSIARLKRSGTASNYLSFSGASYVRYKLENETPSGTTNKMRLQVNAGGVLYFILPQIEEGAFCSSAIVTSGAAATRAADEVKITAPGGKFWFSEKQGYAAVRYRPLVLGLSSDQFVLTLHSGNSNETIGVRVNKTDKDIQAWFRSGNVSLNSLSNDVPNGAGALHALGVAWKPGSGTILQNGVARVQAYSPSPTGLTEANFGHRNSVSEPLWGHVEQVEIGSRTITPGALSARMHNKPGDLLIVSGGQSLASGYFESQESSGAGGVAAFFAAMGALRPRTVASFTNGATGGTAASKTSDASLYWWDLATSTRGPAFDTFYNNLGAGGLNPGILFWAQGEADSHQIGLTTTRQQYKDALIAIFGDIRARFGDVHVVFQRIGRRTSFSNTGGIQTVREVQQEMIDTYTWCHEGPESYDLGLFDVVHPNDAGYAALGPRLARCIAKAAGDSVPGAIGPRMTGAVRTGTSVAVTIAHDSGTDFTPASAIEGFSFFDGASSISITAAVRTNATTITLTLASTPTGVETLYYGYDAMLGLNTANVVRDNSALTMPLRTGKIVL